MALELTDFLPYYPDVDDANLQAEIYQKKEFYDYKLKAEEPVVEIGNKRKLNQQIIVERFFSDHTPYDEGLIYHAMGTGKTCAAFSLSESLKKKKYFKRCIVLAAGKDSLDNLRRELITRCSEDYKFDERGLTPEEIIRQGRKLVSKFYRFDTYYRFAKDCSLLSDEALNKQYTNTIFIVDEAHNIQESEQDEGVQLYKELFRAFHVISKRKILLLTGTPMRNDVSEFASIMNLILPEDKLLLNFKNRFFVKQKDGTYTINADKEGVLKEILRGRISYLTDPKFDIEVRWEGRTPDKSSDIPQFRCVSLVMSPEQTSAYISAYKQDTEGKVGDFYINSIQASLFTFPDGSWGEEGRLKYSTDSEFMASLKNLNILKMYSIKYYHVIKTLLENKNKNTFIYCSSVQGSGLTMLAAILRLYGYVKYSTSDAGTFGRRFIMLTSQTQQISSLIRDFNRNKNKYGDYCQVIIGSRKIAEGYSFKNIQIEMLLTQHWNEAETSQASRRGARFGSWNALRRRDGTFPPNTYLSISKVCAVPNDSGYPSIDIFMLKTSREKDISIKRLDRVIKETAFDCPLTYERNFNPAAKKGSRECEYMECEYKCDFNGDFSSGGSDISTYELYYDNYFDLVPIVINIFERNDSLSLITIYEAVKPQSMTQLLKALVYIIERNINIINRYGLVCFLREHSNIYYLTSDISTPFSSFEYIYTSKPILTKQTNLGSVMDYLTRLNTEKVLEKLGEAKDSSDVREIFSQIDSKTIDVIIKLAIKEKVFRAQNFICGLILELYNKRITLKKTGEYVAVFKDSDDTTWCLKPEGKWVICVAKKKTKKESREEITVEEKQADEYQRNIEKYGYEGIIGGGKFCIRKVNKGEVEDKRKILTGAVCQQAGWKKDKLIEISKQLGIKNISIKDKKDTICKALEVWFKSKGISRRGKCGTARKKKEV